MTAAAPHAPGAPPRRAHVWDLPGPSAARPLLLVHGWTGSTMDFAPVAPALAEDRRVLVPDLPGHGRTPAAGDEAGYALHALAAWLEALLDDLGVGEVHVLGHSLGGLVAQRLASRITHRVCGLVLLGSGPGRPGDVTAERIERVAVAVRERGVEAGWDEIVRGAPDWRSDPRAEAVRARFTAMPAEAIIGAGRAALTASPLGAFLRGLDIPTMVVHGEADDGWPVAQQAALARMVPGAAHVVVPDAMHSPATENPDALIAALRPFLAAADRKAP